MTFLRREKAGRLTVFSEAALIIVATMMAMMMLGMIENSIMNVIAVTVPTMTKMVDKKISLLWFPLHLFRKAMLR